MNNNAVKDWDVDKAHATRAKVLSGRFADHPEKEKSRYHAREVASKKDPTEFASASDVDNAAVVDLFAAKKGYPTVCVDAAAAFSRANASSWSRQLSTWR